MKKKIQLTESELINLIERMVNEYDGGKYEDDDNTEEIDVDAVESYLKEKGWGDLGYENFIDFEKSDYYTGTLNSKKYAIEMHRYLRDESSGINEGRKQYRKKKLKEELSEKKDALDFIQTSVDPNTFYVFDDYYEECLEVSKSEYGYENEKEIKKFCEKNWLNRE